MLQYLIMLRRVPSYVPCWLASEVVMHSTQSLLLHLTDVWYRSLDAGHLVGIVFLDISKAFDTVNHSALLSKLKHQFGFDGSSCEWFSSYLFDRHQAVSMNCACSSFQTTTSRVPQGLVLGPSLFTRYINDLTQWVMSASSALFADDTTMYVVGTSVLKLSDP